MIKCSAKDRKDQCFVSSGGMILVGESTLQRYTMLAVRAITKLISSFKGKCKHIVCCRRVPILANLLTLLRMIKRKSLCSSILTASNLRIV